MSVLAANRTLSKHEYVRAFMKLYDYTEEKLSKTAKRKQKWLCSPIAAIMNDAYRDVMSINNEYLHYGIKAIDKPEQAKKVAEKLESLQKPLLALWNVDRYSERRMIHWVGLIAVILGSIWSG